MEQQKAEAGRQAQEQAGQAGEEEGRTARRVAGRR